MAVRDVHGQSVRQVCTPKHKWPRTSALILEEWHTVGGANQSEVPVIVVHVGIISHFSLEATGSQQASFCPLVGVVQKVRNQISTRKEGPHVGSHWKPKQGFGRSQCPVNWVLDVPWMAAYRAVESVCVSVRLLQVHAVVVHDTIVGAQVQPSNVGRFCFAKYAFQHSKLRERDTGWHHQPHQTPHVGRS